MTKIINLISVVGARPQFIKLAAMHKAIQKDGTLKHIIVHSGQHYDFDMSGQFFEEFDIPKPDYNLEIGSGHQVFQMAKCMTGLVDVFEKEKTGYGAGIWGHQYDRCRCHHGCKMQYQNGTH
ncbi:MAG: UDP-N-acetylglucosamine 2-epimerase [Saprospiraceae bacterium]|nr:UDP-N-acetylglucosamine 2-epimerase [Saprospiraceae bacterium]